LRTPIVSVALAATFCLNGQVLAQTAPVPVAPLNGVLPQFPEANPDFRRDVAPAPIAPAPRELGKPEEDITLDVKGYRIDGGPPALLRDLPRLTREFTGDGKHYEDLVNAASAVTRYLQGELGYYLGYAYLPEQTPADGIVRIAVLEGRLDRVVLNWPDDMPVSREVIEPYLARLKPGSVLTVAEVERTIFLINDLHGVATRFEVQPGREVGTATLVVTPRAEARWSGRVDGDNFGSRYSGLWRGNVAVDLASPGGRGDKLSVGMLETHTDQLNFVLAGYSRPIGADGLKVGVSASFVRYQLEKKLLPLDLSGTALAMTGYGLYPVIRSRNLNLFTLASFEQKQYDDKQGAADISTRKRTNSASLSLSGDFRDSLAGGAVSTYEFTGTTGRLIYATTRPAALDNPEGYRKLGLSYSRLQSIVDNRLLGYVVYRRQFALDNLDTTEQFRVGGPDGVRAYAPGEGTGDAGTLATGELRLLPPESVFGPIARELVFSGFYDWGKVRYRHDASRQPATFVNGSIYSGGGIGATWERPRNFNLRFSAAFRNQGVAVADPSNRNPRFYVQFSKKF